MARGAQQGGQVRVNDILEDQAYHSPHCCGAPILFPDKQTQWFLVFVIAQLLGVMGISIWTLSHDSGTTANIAYSVCTIFNVACVLYYVLDGVFREQPMELYAFVASSFATVSYITYNYFVNSNKDNLELARMVVAFALQIPNVWVVYRLSSSEWLVFRITGADGNMQAAYKRYRVFVTLLKFDLQSCVSLFILALFAKLLFSTLVLALSIAGLVGTLFWVISGWLMAKYENRCWAVPFFLFATAAPTYIIYRFIDIDINWESSGMLTNELAYPVFVVGAASLLIRCSVFVCAYLVLKNFGQGLADHLSPPPRYQALGARSNRQ